MIRLSGRLEAVSSFVKGSRVISDVGCDHGLLPLCLLEKNEIEYAYLLDKKKEPLLRAEKNVLAERLTERTRLVLSDGLLALPEEIRKDGAFGYPDTVVISGMGGPLILEILKKAPEDIKKNVKKYVLSPQSELRDFRSALGKEGYEIRDEGIVRDQGKYYFILEVFPSLSGEKTEEREIYLRYGKAGLKKKDKVLLEAIERDIRMTLEILKNPDIPGDRREFLKNELMIMKEAESEYEMP